jgi:hypothetical protein
MQLTYKGVASLISCFFWSLVFISMISCKQKKDAKAGGLALIVPRNAVFLEEMVYREETDGTIDTLSYVLVDIKEKKAHAYASNKLLLGITVGVNIDSVISFVSIQYSKVKKKYLEDFREIDNRPGLYTEKTGKPVFFKDSSATKFTLTNSLISNPGPSPYRHFIFMTDGEYWLEMKATPSSENIDDDFLAFQKEFTEVHTGRALYRMVIADAKETRIYNRSL